MKEYVRFKTGKKKVTVMVLYGMPILVFIHELFASTERKKLSV